MEDLASRVRSRARNCCEYCQLPQVCYDYIFHIDHAIPRKHGGKTTMGNLALACPQCNFHKSSNISTYILIKTKRVLVRMALA
jgi:5-methylcytosine-specific restriction endonuclease McrA